MIEHSRRRDAIQLDKVVVVTAVNQTGLLLISLLDPPARSLEKKRGEESIRFANDGVSNNMMTMILFNALMVPKLPKSDKQIRRAAVLTFLLVFAGNYSSGSFFADGRRTSCSARLTGSPDNYSTHLS